MNAISAAFAIVVMGCQQPAGPAPGPSTTVVNASSPSAPAVAAPTLSDAERARAWRWAVTIYVYQGVLQRAIAERDRVYDTCGKKHGAARDNGDWVEVCAPEYIERVRQLEATLPVLEGGNDCPARHAKYTLDLLDRTIAQSQNAMKYPQNRLGAKGLRKRNVEQPPELCPAQKYFVCETPKGPTQCQWLDMWVLYTDVPDADPEHEVLAMTLTDGTPVTRAAVARRLDDYVEADPLVPNKLRR